MEKDEAAGIKSTIRTNREYPTWSGRDPGNHWRGDGVLVGRVKGSEGGCEGEERCYLKGGGDLSLHLRKHRVKLGGDLGSWILGLNLCAREMRGIRNGLCGMLSGV